MIVNKNSKYWELRNYINPEKIENIGEITPEDKVDGSFIELHNNTIYVNGQIGRYGAAAKDFDNALAKVPTNAELTVVINSEGGNAWDVWQMYNSLKQRNNVTTQVNSIAASAATTLMLAGERRLISKTGSIMIHRNMTLTFGNTGDHDASNDMLKQRDEVLIDNYAEVLNIGKEEISNLLVGKYNGMGTWFNASQALDLGFATEIKDMDENFERVSNVAALYDTKIPKDIENSIKKRTNEYEQRKNYLDNLERMNSLL